MEKIEVTGKTVEDALTNALVQLETTSDKVEYEVIEKGSSGILGIFNSKPAKISVWKKDSMEDRVRDFLTDVFGAMSMQVTIEMTLDEDEETININRYGCSDRKERTDTGFSSVSRFPDRQRRSGRLYPRKSRYRELQGEKEENT